MITLYAARRPTFVVDAYARRLLERLELAPAASGYEGWRRELLAASGDEVERLGEWHSLIVVHGKERCPRAGAALRRLPAARSLSRRAAAAR